MSRKKYTSADALRCLGDQPEKFGVAALAVADYQDEEQEVRHTPTPDDGGHCDVVGAKTNGVKNRLRKKARIRIPPPPS